MSGTHLSLKQAAVIANGALAAGVDRGFAPLCVAVLDGGGHILVILRDECSSLNRPQIAIAKASGCLGMGFGGRELAKRAQAMPQFFSALSSIFPNGIIPVAGGVLIRNAERRICGAIGVSGETSDNDEICAVVGIEGAAFIADAGSTQPTIARTGD
jgi:uncharacterized protein GlcG (DUF336 family)